MHYQPFLIMQKKDLKKIFENFENKAYDAKSDYWYNLISLIVFILSAAVALIFYLFD